MNAGFSARLAASLVLATGLLTAPAIPVFATAPPPAAVTAKPKPKLPDRCWPSYKHDLQRLQRRMGVELAYYDNHYTPVDNLLNTFIEVLSSDDAQEALPGLEQAAMGYRDGTLPVVAESRDEVDKLVNMVQKSNKGCFSGKRQDKFLAGMKTVRSAYRDLFRAHEKVLMASGYLTTAQTAKAQGALNDAQVEAATVEDRFDQGIKQLRDLW